MNEVLVNSADWPDPDVPEQVPGDWMVANAPRPIAGEIAWTGPFRHGVFYAAAPPGPVDRWGWPADDAWMIRTISDDVILEAVLGKAADYGYADVAALEDAGISIADVAADMRLPWKGNG